MHDEEHSGRPSVITDDLLELVRERIMENRRFTVTELSSFQNNREAEMSVTQWFQSQAAEVFVTGIQKLVSWYEKCLKSGGEYVEK